MINALGLVETIGYVAAIEALDVCLKSASVEVVGIQKVGQGIVTIEVEGDVGAVKAAIEAAGDAVRRIGTLRSTHVIPRLHNDVYEAIFQKEEQKQQEVSETVTIEDIQEEEIIEELEALNLDEIENVDIIEDINAIEYIDNVEEIIEEKAKDDSGVKPNLSKLSVKELKNLAKSLESKMTYKELNTLKKEELISLVDKFYREGE